MHMRHGSVVQSGSEIGSYSNAIIYMAEVFAPVDRIISPYDVYQFALLQEVRYQAPTDGSRGTQHRVQRHIRSPSF